MKCAMIFTVVVIVGLGIVAGADNEEYEHDLLLPRSQAYAPPNPLAPAGIVGRRLPGSSVDKVRRDLQTSISQYAETHEFTTTTNPPVMPAEYNGDVRDLPRVPAKAQREVEPHAPLSVREAPDSRAGAAAGDVEDVANNVSVAAMPGPIQNFQGLSLNDDCAGANCGIGQPPDTNGDVGLNHYVLAVNFGIAVYSKTGQLLARFSEDTLWQGANTGTPCDEQSHGDPVVVYDQFADRWIISNFAFGFNSSGPASPFYQCFAVSKTGDPVSGGWRLYPLRVDNGTAGQPPAGALGDYPKLGNWNDGCLYLSSNEFTFPGGKFVGTLFASINKSDMYNGLPLTSAVGFINDPSTAYSMIPSNISGATQSDLLPPAGTPNYFVAQGRSAYAFEVRAFTPGTSPKICGGGGTFTASVRVAQTSWDTPDNISQPNANDLGSVGERLMQKIQYRRQGVKEFLWVVHSVESPANSTVRSQWAQIDVTGKSIKTTPVQQQIYAPDTTIERWIPSIAADHDSNVAIGYNTSSPSKFPSIAYSGRLASDPLNQLPQGETELIAGSGSQRNQCEGGPCRRWGDYSSMSIDPVDDCTFWYANQYYDSQGNGDSGNWQTRIGSFKFPSCVGTTLRHTLSVASSNPDFGVPMTVSPNDAGNLNNGTVPFSRTYQHNISVNLTAELKANGNNFKEWQRDGVTFSTNAATTVVVDGDHTMKAVYETSNTRTLTVKSTDAVNISVTTDVNNLGAGQPQFDRSYDAGSTVRLTAPATAGAKAFKRWDLDGFQWDVAATTTVTADSDHVITAVYEAVTTVNVTVEAKPAGASFTVDGSTFTSSQNLSWAPNSTHTIAASSTQSINSGTQLAFNSWSDGGNISHTVTASQSQTYTANYNTQYLLTMNTGDGGTTRPTTGFYDAGQTISINATPQDRFSFEGWTGTGTVSFVGPFKNGTVVMNGPITETGIFSQINTSVQFSSASYNVNEADGIVNVTVTRNGPPTDVDQISYVTTDGTAIHGHDFILTGGVVTFQKGESTKTFPVLIINNSFVDGTRSFVVTLSQPQGANLGTPSSATITISDDDKVPGANPLDDAHAFVQFHYYDFLARYPDTSGWDFWTNQIKGCGTNSACLDVARVNTSGAFFLSIEFQESGYEVERLYKAAYGDVVRTSTLGGSHQINVPVIRFDEFIAGKGLITDGVVVNQGNWQQKLEDNKQLFVRGFVRTDRFAQAFPTTLTPAQYVDKLNQNAGNVLSASERTAAINLFFGAADSNNFPARVTALRQVAEDADLIAAEKNKAFVLSQYFGYLRRNPDDPPDKPGDYTGYDFWLTKLNDFKGDFVAAQMVQAFITAGEYRGRFGP